jgi:broad specificity phosphatase PhoE
MNSISENHTEPAEDPDLRLVLLRAAETGFTRAGRMEGDIDLPLTDRGRAAVGRLVTEILDPLGGPDAVYSAANQSSRETAEVVASGNGMRVKVLSGLRGLSLGLWEGQLLADVRQRHARVYENWYRDPLCITPPGGEEMEDALRRTKVAANSILKKHRRGTVAVVAPEAVIGLFCCHLGQCTPDRVFKLTRNLGPAEVVALSGRVRV